MRNERSDQVWLETQLGAEVHHIDLRVVRNYYMAGRAGGGGGMAGSGGSAMVAWATWQARRGRATRAFRALRAHD